MTADGDRRDDAASDALEAALADELAAREAAAFVHAGSSRDPRLDYCRPTLGPGRHAIAFAGDEWHVRSAIEGSGHPADALAGVLTDGGLAGTVLTPAEIPHDAALYLEAAGFSLASSDVVERARARKTDGERARIATAQAAASAGVRRAAALLDDATVVDGHLATEGGDETVTMSRLRTALDEAIVSAGAYPAGTTEISVASDDGALRPGDAIVLEVTPRERGGYRGGLVRTAVVDGDGGEERRAHVAVTQAFRSAAAMLTADAQSVAAVEADLEAEIRAFGFADEHAIETRVAGVGLEARERPCRKSREVAPGSVIRLDASVATDAGRVRLADLLAVGPEGVEWIESTSRSLDPAALAGERRTRGP